MIENKVIQYLTTSDYKAALHIDDPRLFVFIFENQITNDLGFKRIRKQYHEGDITTIDGLKMHLKTMDARISDVNKQYYKFLFVYTFDKLVQAENELCGIHKKINDAYEKIKCSTTYMQLINELAKKAEEHKMELINQSLNRMEAIIDKNMPVSDKK